MSISEQQMTADGLGIGLSAFNVLKHTGEEVKISEAPTRSFQSTQTVARNRELAQNRQRERRGARPRESVRLPIVPAGTDRTSLPPVADDPDLQVKPDILLEKVLDSAYRGQAETFVRKASRMISPPGSTPRLRSRSSASDMSAPPTDTATAAAAATPTRITSTRTQAEEREVPEERPELHRRAHTVSGAEAAAISAPLNGPEVHAVSCNYSLTQAGGLSTSELEHSRFLNRSSRLLRALPKQPNIRKKLRKLPSQIFPFFTKKQREDIEKQVYSKKHGCERHQNCSDCTNIEFAYHENKIMSTSIPADERQKIIANNKSLRTIKNELESLSQSGAISDATYDTIMNALPSEAPLNSAARSNVAASPSPNSLNAAVDNMRINSSPAPPAYANATATPPVLPERAPSQTNEKPEIGRATGLYPYNESPEDCTFEVNDTLIIYEYMNNDWCYGKNLRTGKQGLFPTNYIQIHQQPPTPNPSAYGTYGNEKQNSYAGGYPGQYQQAQGPPPPGPSNPYNSAVPPMQIAEQPTEAKPNKGAEMGKKFGKKLGNAAIFGAGATLGADLVNSIF